MTMFLNWVLRRERARAKAKAMAINRATPELPRFHVPCPHKSFKFVFSTECPKEEKQNLCMDEIPLGTASFRVIEMPSNVLEDFQKVDILLFRPHDHGSCADRKTFRPMSFPEVSSARMPDNLIHISRLAVVGSFMYALYLHVNGHIVFKSYNLSDGVQLTLPAPSSSSSSSCDTCRKLVTLRGKLYLLRDLTDLSSLKDHPFAEVFDPTTNKWSEIAQPPHDAKRISYGDFIASLGETEGKLMVYHSSREDVYPCKDTEFTLYFYDVTTDEWGSESCSGFAEGCGLGAIIGKEVLNEDDGTLYWLSTNGLIYALDWKKRRVYSCPIGGLEQVDMFRYLENVTMGVSFHHLWSEFFCVIWCAHCSTKSDARGGTEYHYTFLRVIMNSSNETLDAVVLGCFVDSYDYRCGIFDAVRV